MKKQAKKNCGPASNCKKGLRKNIISKTVFEREIAVCRELNKEGKCAWGRCNNCGVIPLLYKLHKGQLFEESLEVKAIKDEIFS